MEYGDNEIRYREAPHHFPFPIDGHFLDNNSSDTVFMTSGEIESESSSQENYYKEELKEHCS